MINTQFEKYEDEIIEKMLKSKLREKLEHAVSWKHHDELEKLCKKPVAARIKKKDINSNIYSDSLLEEIEEDILRGVICKVGRRLAHIK